MGASIGRQVECMGFKCASILQLGIAIQNINIYIGRQSKSIGCYYLTFKIRKTEMMQSKILPVMQIRKKKHRLNIHESASILVDEIEQIYDLYAFYAMHHCSF